VLLLLRAGDGNLQEYFPSGLSCDGCFPVDVPERAFRTVCSSR